MSVIRHNTDTGNLAVYADKAAAGSGMPVYASEADILKGKASISELVRFYNKIAPSPVKTFKDKTAAARRVWAVVQGSPIAPEEEVATPVAEPTEATEVKKRGRQAGSGEFAGKTIFARKDVNPRRIGTAGFKSFEIIRGVKEGVPYADYIKSGGRPNDLRWDIEHKWAEVK